MTHAPQHPTSLPHTILGYPRIGPNREIKSALEAFWSGESTGADLHAAIDAHHCGTAARLRELGLTAPAAQPFDGSLIDTALDAIALLGLLPERFAAAGFTPADPDSEQGYELLTALSRGTAELAPLELTKWFDTNYHYYVPEIAPETACAPVSGVLSRRYAEQTARAGAPVRPVLLGPISLLLLAKAVAGDAAGRIDRAEEIAEAYAGFLRELAAAGAEWVQLDEPALASDAWDVDAAAIRSAVDAVYTRLAGASSPGGAAAERPQILVAVGYGTADPAAVQVLATAGVEAIGFDLVDGEAPGSEVLAAVAGRTLLAGIVSGENIWRTDLPTAFDTLRRLASDHDGPLAVGTSTSLLHVPHDVSRETAVDEEVRGWLAFADEKIGEVLTLGSALDRVRADERALDEVSAALTRADEPRMSRAGHPLVVREGVRARIEAIAPTDRARASAEERQRAQADISAAGRNGLPLLPTTTIGSFPQTAEIRRVRAGHRAGRISDAEYTEQIRGHIADVIRRQEEIGLDVLVHGEAERNDMVQYFAEHLSGFLTTEHGWVQSYGSRCLRPPILVGDVERSEPITVEWIRYAASLTDSPVKGMLTGPVTILAWSFVRDDQPLQTTADQIALALRDEVVDLAAAGVRIIQVDEPALRELLPLSEAARPDYLRWSVDAFRLATAGASAEVQIHTHLCYSEFDTVIGAIDGLDADVTTLEASRSGFAVIDALDSHGYSRGIGPGVWDIHSPRVPSVDEIAALLRRAVSALDARTVWANPDCGLKTRGWKETEASLRNLVEATALIRAEIAGDAQAADAHAGQDSGLVPVQ